MVDSKKDLWEWIKSHNLVFISMFFFFILMLMKFSGVKFSFFVLTIFLTWFVIIFIRCKNDIKKNQVLKQKTRGRVQYPGKVSPGSNRKRTKNRIRLLLMSNYSRETTCKAFGKVQNAGIIKQPSLVTVLCSKGRVALSEP